MLYDYPCINPLVETSVIHSPVKVSVESFESGPNINFTDRAMTPRLLSKPGDLFQCIKVANLVSRPG